MILIYYYRVIERLDSASYSSGEFSNLTDRLKLLAIKRREQRQKLELFKSLQKQVSLLKEAQSTIQPNLVTRDGPVADELQKSNMLGVTVNGRAAGLKRNVDNTEFDQDFKVTNSMDKLKDALGRNQT
jgi:hypothetical protein